MQFLDSKTIKLDRILSELDMFVSDFLKILEKHTDYVIVSGYVAILFGRSRTTEDVDILIPHMRREQFSEFFDDVMKNGLWFLNSSKMDDLYEILSSKSGIRISKEGDIDPNFEIKFVKNPVDEAALKNRLKVNMDGCSLYIGPLELQIVYKEKVLRSFKDKEDARHLRIVFKGHLSEELFEHYRRLIYEDENKGRFKGSSPAE